MTLLANFSAQGPGATDRLLAVVFARLQVEGVRVIGALRAPPENGGANHCNSDLWLLPNGPLVRITQNLGAGSRACRMDAGALEEAVALVTARLANEDTDLVFLNKFGRSEAEGRGFRAFIARALSEGIPVLTSVSETHRAAFEALAEGMTIHIAPEEDAILAWCRAAVASHATQTEEV